jgi:hypothetical protein
MFQPPEIYKTITATRFAAGARVGGRWVEGASSTITFTGYIESISEQTARNKFITLDAGHRWQGGILIITDEDLQLMESGNSGRNADRIQYLGTLWEVQGNDDFEFTTLAEAHHEYLGIRVTQ